MTFLNPLVLFGLLAAAIPVLLHLLSLRKLRTIEFSTLRFIKELQRTRIRRLKLRQLLLLLLRTLLIILIVLAFARPTLRGSFIGGVTTEAKTSAVVLIDNSSSMTASDIHGEYLKQAREAAAQILELFSDGDEVSVLPLSQATMGTASLTARRPADAAAALGMIEPSHFHRKLGEGLREAARLLRNSRNLNKEVYLVSDIQNGLLPRRRDDPEVVFDPGVRLFVVPIGQRELRNLSVESLEIPDAIIETGKPFALKAVLRNHSRATVSNQLVSVFLNGTRIGQRGVTIEGGRALDVEFSIVPKTSGQLPGFVELEDDDLSFDNRRYFSLSLPDQINVLLVGSDSDLRYVATALATRQEPGSVLRTQTLPYDRLTSSILTSFDVVILSGFQQISSLQSEALHRFVSGGGGLVVFPGPAMTPAGFASLQDRLGLPRLVAVESADGQSISFVEFDRAELRHPLFHGMFREDDLSTRSQRARSLETPRIRTYARFQPGEEATPLITLSGGSPFLLEQRIGSGRTLIFAVSTELSFSDFPLKGIFVPLIHRAVAYAAQEQVRQSSVTSGEEVRIAGIALQRATVVTPRKFEIPLILRQGNAAFAETVEPGVYEVRNGRTLLKTFSVNMDPDESMILPADEEELLALFEALGIQAGAVRTLDRSSPIRGTIMETRHGVELWKQLLVAALMVALIEAVIARENRDTLARFTTEAA